MIRPFEKSDLVWLRPIAEKYGSWEDLKRGAADPDGCNVVVAFVIAPYVLGTMFLDEHGTVLEGLCDTWGIKQFMRLGHFMCKLADDCGTDLHNHKGQKAWERSALRRLGFIDEPGRDWIRYTFGKTEKEVA